MLLECLEENIIMNRTTVSIITILVCILSGMAYLIIIDQTERTTINDNCNKQELIIIELNHKIDSLQDHVEQYVEWGIKG